MHEEVKEILQELKHVCVCVCVKPCLSLLKSQLGTEHTQLGLGTAVF